MASATPWTLQGTQASWAQGGGGDGTGAASTTSTVEGGLWPCHFITPWIQSWTAMNLWLLSIRNFECGVLIAVLVSLTSVVQEVKWDDDNDSSVLILLWRKGNSPNIKGCCLKPFQRREALQNTTKKARSWSQCAHSNLAYVTILSKCQDAKQWWNNMPWWTCAFKSAENTE